MLNAVLNINSDSVVAHTARLEKISKSAMPVVIRQTLNAAAYDVKMKTMPDSSSVFVKREINFLKANSKVDPAKGFDVNRMAATVGFMNIKPKPVAHTDLAVQDLEEQENGGEIGGRAFIALKGARVSNSFSKRVKAVNRLKEIEGKMIDSADAEGNSRGQRFIKSAIFAGVGGYVMGNKKNSKGNKMVYRVNSIARNGSNTMLKMTPLYALKAGRTVAPPATHFMRKASDRSADKMESFYIANANKKLNSVK